MKNTKSIKPTVLFYKEHWRIIKKLKTEQIGLLFSAVFDYVINEKEPNFSDMSLDILFEMLKIVIDKDEEKYNSVCETNKKNIQKRYDRIPSYTTVYDGIHKDKEKEKEKDIHKDKEKEKEKEKEKDIKLKLKKAPSDSKDIPYAQIIRGFNKLCFLLPSVKNITESRRAAIEERWREHPNTTFFDAYFEKVNNTLFLTGRKKDFKATFDWLMRAENMQKVLEGNYDDPEGYDDMPGFVRAEDLTDDECKNIFGQ